MNVILIRHGQSEYNVRLTSNLDSRLTPEGVNQVQRAAQKLVEQFPDINNFDGITSPYYRCLQTAEIISQITGIQFRVDTGPREIMSIYDPVEIRSHHGDFEFPGFLHEGWRFDTETIEQYQSRLKEFARSITRPSVVVSHGTPVVTLSKWLRGEEEIDPDLINYVENASLTHVKDGNLALWNDYL